MSTLMAGSVGRSVRVVEHPLVQAKLGELRAADTPPARFRAALRECAWLLGYELLRDLPTQPKRVITPLGPAEATELALPAVFVSILRAGNGLLDGLLDLVPQASVGHVGLYRDPDSLQAVEYYFKVPADIAKRPVFVLDPMLATGHSAIAALDRLAQAGARPKAFLALLCAPEGIDAIHTAHPEIPIVTAAVDQGLNDRGYIVPGLGDAGDRIFATAHE